MELHANADLLETLNFYAQQGYQIVFDENGIRVWYRFCFNAPKLYEGKFMSAALQEIENHFAKLPDDCKAT